MTPRTAPAPEAVAARPAGIARWLPGVAVLRAYRREWLPRELVAGLVLSALLVPQGMAYAELAGLPPITGLYATVVCLVAYAAVGPSGRRRCSGWGWGWCWGPTPPSAR